MSKPSLNLETLASEGRLTLILTSADQPGEGLHKQALQLGIRNFSFDKEMKLGQKAKFMNWGIEANKRSGGSYRTQHGTWAELKLAREAELVAEATKREAQTGFDPFA